MAETMIEVKIGTMTTRMTIGKMTTRTTPGMI